MYVIYSHFKKLIYWSRKLLAEVNFHNCTSNLKTGHDVGSSLCNGIFIIVSVLDKCFNGTVFYLLIKKKHIIALIGVYCLWVLEVSQDGGTSNGYLPKVNVKRRTLLLCFE